MQQRHRVGGQVREVTANQARVGNDVGADGLRLEALGGRGLVGARGRAMQPDGPGPEAGRVLGGAQVAVDLLGLRGGEEIAAPVHQEDVAALARQLFHQVDAAVHQGHHRVAGPRPPVAVGLGGLVAGQRERGALVHQDDPPDATADRQVIRGGDPGHARSADHHLGRRRAHGPRLYTLWQPADTVSVTTRT